MTPVNTTKTSRNAAMMTSTSLLVLGLFCAAPAMAQSTLTGAPGQALTAGTVSTTSGTIYDGGTGGYVSVYSDENNDTQTATGAEISAVWTALNFESDASLAGLLTVVVDGNSQIHSSNGHAVTVYTGSESLLLDTSSGGNTFTANGGNGLEAGSSNGGSVTVLNGANTIHVSGSGISARTDAADITIDSVGGTIDAYYGGISASTDGNGNIVIGQGTGITTAISLYERDDEDGVSAPGTGIEAYSFYAGTIDIRTGAGGTIDGGETGIHSQAADGATTVNVGAAIGGATAPSNVGVYAFSRGGAITVNTTAAVSGNTVGLNLDTQGGEGSQTVNIGGNVTSNGSGVVLSVSEVSMMKSVTPLVFDGLGAIPAPTGTGGASLTLTGPVAILANGQYGVDVRTVSGAINVTALDGLSSITATDGASVNLYSQTGDINLTSNGTISSTGGAGLYAATAGDIDLRVGTVTTVGGSSDLYAGASSGFAVNVNATGGNVNVAASGPVTGGAAGGINVRATGNAAVSVTADSVTTVGGRAVTVYAGTGDVSIATTGSIQAYGSGLLAENAGAGTVTVHAAGPVTSLYGTGLIAQNIGGLGAVTVGTADQRIGGLITGGFNGNGINALGAGDVSVYAGAVTARNRAIVAASQYAGTNGRVLIDVTGPVLSTGFYGIVGVNNGALASNSITVRAADTVTGTGATAISAQTNAGDIFITALGDLVSHERSDGYMGDGIYANSEAQGAITISATGGIVSGYDGIYARSVDSTLYEAVAASSGSDDGRIGAAIGAPAASGIDIYTTGAVSGLRAYGIYGYSDTGSVNIVSGGSVTGLSDAIRGASSGGDVTISTADAGATNGFGVYAERYGSGNSAVQVNVTGASTVSGETGISVVNGSTGAVTVSSAAGSHVIGRDGSGVDARANGGLLTIAMAGSVTGGEESAGIYTENQNSGGIDINVDGAVAGQTGIFARTGTGAINIGTLLDRSTGPITAAGGPGVYAETAGNIGIHVGAVSATGGDPVTFDADRHPTPLSSQSGYGILALSSAGTVTIDANGLVSGGAAGGIYARTAGTNALSISTAAVTAAAGDAIQADAFGGNISIVTTGAINAALVGIEANNRNGGAISILSGGSVTSGAGTNGINARANGAGTVTIGSTEQRTGPVVAGATGVFATSEGDINVAVGSVTGATRGIVASNQRATGSLAVLNGRVVIDASGPVTGETSYGIIGINNGLLADNTLTIRTAGPVTSTSGSAISAQTIGGNIDITAQGSILSNAGPTWFGDGIYAEASGTGAVSVLATGASISGYDGIYTATRATSGIGIDVQTTGVVSGLTQFGLYGRALGASVNLASQGTATGVLGGLVATTSGGSGNVTVSTANADSANGMGVSATITNAGTGLVRVNVTGASTVSGVTGVLATTDGSGAVTVASNTAGSRVIGTGGAGVQASANGGLLTVALAGGATGATGHAGVSAINTGSGAVNVNVDGAVSGTTGIYAVTGTGAIDIGTAGDRSTGSITANGAPGIYAATAGNIGIHVGAVSTTGGNPVSFGDDRQPFPISSDSGYAILALSSAGTVTIDANGLVSGGAAGGIYARTAGTNALSISTAAVTAAAGDAIQADAFGGNISVVTTGAINAALVGIETNNRNGGAISILSGGSVTSGAGTNGINARSNGTGSVTIGSTAQRTGPVVAGATGVFATSEGDINVVVSSVTGATRGIVAANQRTTSSSPAANGRVVIDATGPVIGQSSFGIIGVNNGVLASNTLVINALGPVTSTGGSGISAQVTNGGGDITIRSGAVTANSSTNGTWDGIFADGRGDSLISIATTGTVSGSNYGIDAFSTGSTARAGVNIAAGGSVIGGDGRSAIAVNLYGQGSAQVTTAAGTTLSARGGVGAHVNVHSATGSNNVQIDNFASIGGVGADRVNMGLNAWIGSATNAGSIAINSTGGTIHAIERGIYANTLGTGSINIGGTAGISTAIITGHTGIQAQTTTGAIDIRTAAGGTIAPGAVAGIFATSGSGAITINQAGAIGTVGTGNTVDLGILAIIDSGNEALTINSTGGIYISAGTGLQSAGIYAVHNGTGAINVTTSGIIDPGAYGVVLQGAGNVAYTAAGGLVEGDLGVYATSTTGGTVSVASLAGSTILGLNGIGVQAVGTGGAVNIATGGAVSGTTSGVVASNTGTGATSVVVTGTATGQNGAGISVTGANGLTTVSALGNVSGSTAGITASTTGTGALAVTSAGTVSSASGPAINLAAGTGGLQLNLGGNVISGTGPAVVASTTGSGVVNVAAGAVIAGRVNSPTDSVIALNTASGTASTINVAQGATIQAVSGSAFTTAIRATGGSVVVNNSGNIIGQVDFSALTGTNSGSLASGVGTTFQTGGLSTFSVGNDTFVNAGQLITQGQSTTFDFRGGTNVFNNSGTVRVGTAPVLSGGSVFRLTGLTTLNNSGTLQLVNGVAGDSLIAPGATYVGSGAARLAVDTRIGGAAPVSDVLTVGSTSGRTTVLINDVTPAGSFSANNPTGVLIVSGTTHAGDFVLDAGSSYYNANVFGGVIESQGMFYSQLAVDPARGTVLISAPKVQAYQFATLGRQAQAVWHGTAPRTERQAEVRDQLAAGSATGGFWVDVNGTRQSRDAEQTATNLAGPVTYNTGYDQHVTSAIVGVDRVLQLGDAAWVVGGAIGHVDSRADFSQGNAAIDMSGVTVSGYASVVRNGLFASASIGFNSLDAEIKARDLAGFTEQETQVKSLGAAIEVGVRTPLSNGMVFEPSVGLAYVDSQVDGFAAAGAGFGEQNGESLRVSLGVRMSGALEDSSDWATRYHVSLRGIGETLGDNEMVLTSGGPALTLADRFDTPFAELRAGMTSQKGSGWSVYGDGVVRYNNDYNELGVTIGLRLKY